MLAAFPYNRPATAGGVVRQVVAGNVLLTWMMTTKLPLLRAFVNGNAVMERDSACLIACRSVFPHLCICCSASLCRAFFRQPNSHVAACIHELLIGLIERFDYSDGDEKSIFFLIVRM